MCIPRDIINLAFNLNDRDSLSKDQKTICVEWCSGSGFENMKVPFNDPKLLQCIGLYNKCLENINDKYNELF
jgi:hypothetical protein